MDKYTQIDELFKDCLNATIVREVELQGIGFVAGREVVLDCYRVYLNGGNFVLLVGIDSTHSDNHGGPAGSLR